MLETFASVLIALLVLATFVEGFVEFFLSDIPFFKQNSTYLRYASLVFGVIVCSIYQLDLFAALGIVSSVPYVGAIFTGVIIGRGSNYLNDFVSKVRTSVEVTNEKR